MEDEKIIELYWNRDERAINETELKYGAYLNKIAWNILYNWDDCSESVNDTYFKTWTTIPPQRPSVFSAFLAKITRSLSIDLLRKKTSKKRSDSQYTLSLNELSECVSDQQDTLSVFELQLLSEAINRYLSNLSKDNRLIFVGRYFFCDSIKEIAAKCGFSETKVKVQLHRCREGLKAFLEKEGFDL